MEPYLQLGGRGGLLSLLCYSTKIPTAVHPSKMSLPGLGGPRYYPDGKYQRAGTDILVGLVANKASFPHYTTHPTSTPGV